MDCYASLLSEFPDQRTLGRLTILDRATGKPVASVPRPTADKQQLPIGRKREAYTRATGTSISPAQLKVMALPL